MDYANGARLKTTSENSVHAVLMKPGQPVKTHELIDAEDANEIHKW